MSKKNYELFRSSFESIYNLDSLSTRTTTSELSGTVVDAILECSNQPSFPTTNNVNDEYRIQTIIREWFGKNGINTGSIGAHPDFARLGGTDETKYHHITTVFIDIKNSTRLSLRYDLEMVQKIKNAILRAASETVRALDGHVHRFMGDALMAYFGGVGQDREGTSMAAISCAALLRLLMEESIRPTLQSKGVDPKDIGFRVGIDYGDDRDVLWSSYGYTDVSEVTATSFYVDAAAKLQSMASKDNTMLGNQLVQHIDLPEFLIKQKTERRNGEPVVVPYLLPNYELETGSSHNYKIHELIFTELVR
ncbi:MAG: adenylate/guanylate cyclase domain-containing protein, partial [Vibrionaceae bacterium]